MILVKNAHKTYFTGKVRVEALRGVSMEISEGEFLSIMGPSGCGKSTLMHCLGALDTLDEGEISIGGEVLNGKNDKALTDFRKNSIGFVFQFFNLLPTLTVEENILLPAALSGKNEADYLTEALDLLNHVGMKEKADRFIGELSGGEIQRVAIARALLLRPKLLLADEPTGNLDSKKSGEVMDLLHEVNREYKTTIAIVTHSDEIASRTHRTIRMRDGKVESS